MLRVANPAIGQLPTLLHRQSVELGTGISHRRIEIRELAVRCECEVERLLHSFVRVIGQTEDVVADYVYPTLLYFSYSFDNLFAAETTFFHSVSDMLGGRLNPKRKPSK